MKIKRMLTLGCAALLALSACSSGEAETGLESEAQDPDAEDVVMTVRAERDAVTVNGTELASGTVQEAVPGDVVKVVDDGAAEITAPSVVEIEALRGGTVTVPDPAAGDLDVGLEVGHIFVTLDPAANTTLVVDAGDRTFTTGAADTSFALCQAPDGASCLVVMSGEVTWAEDGVAEEEYSAGQASFAARGNAPEPARCADTNQIGEMQRTLRGLDFAGALATIVAEWDDCPPEGADLESFEQVTIPSAARMEQVSVEEATIGLPDVDEDTDTVLAAKPVEEALDYYIEPLAATNGEFRAWLVSEAGDDAGAWQRLAPQDWLDRAPGGAATQAIYANGSADEPVRGIAYGTAVQYCAAQAKRLPTEIEWEVAATSDVLRDLAEESQDWVADWQAYGPGPDGVDGRQVLRGANGTLAVDPYYRVFAVDTPDATAARRYARVRCAATEVAIGGQTFPTVLVSDDFNSLDWPLLDEEPFELDYHPENYHLDVSAQHGQMSIVRALEEPLTTGRMDTDVFIERNNTSPGQGAFRFGVVLGTPEDLRLFTVQPNEFAGDRFLACVAPLDEEMVAGLALVDETLVANNPGRFATVGPNSAHGGEDCVGATASVEVPVSSIDSPVRLTVVAVDGQLEMWVNDVLVDASSSISSLGVYGFYSQTYHRDRTHIHFDDLIITGA